MSLPDPQQPCPEPPGHLPPELLIQIFSHLSSMKNAQGTLHSSTLVSRQWYSSAVPALYRSPVITGKNFAQFVRTLCPSVNSRVKRNGLAEMVRRLDMSALVHDGSRSVTARMLRRCQESLEEFVAPKASFAVNSFAALSKCTNLRRLDLSFIDYTLDLYSLLNSIKNLDKLEYLNYPLSCTPKNIKIGEHPPSWPMNLRELHIPGNLGDDSLHFLFNFPSSLTRLGIGNCSRLFSPSVHLLLLNLGPQLESLDIQRSRTNFGDSSFDEILVYLPVLRRLSIPAAYISAGFFTCVSNSKLKGFSPLVELELTCSSEFPYWENERVDIDYNHVWDAVVDGGLDRLRRLKLHRNLKWDLSREARRELKSLDEMLQALAREDAEASGSHEPVDAGVWMIGK
ncbi:hypothetical protein MMC29_005955 [Sticta canariensis]|nr:hypothetical protein [Sticta canariensis]